MGPPRRRAASYASYLKLPSLLAAQDPLTSVNDAVTWASERFFIVCHQSTELWLSQILVDLRRAARFARPPADWDAAAVSLRRAASMVAMLYHHLELLPQLPREDFLRFRTALEGSSGADSVQFHALFHAVSAAPSSEATTVARHLDKAAAAENESEATAAGRRAARAALDDIVQGVLRWRRRHVAVVRHFIGDLPGTGGTTGVEYLMRQFELGDQPR